MVRFKIGRRAAQQPLAPGTGHVFISYAHADANYVKRLADSLRRRGMPTWYDDEVPTGQRWVQVLRQMVDSAAALVLVMTPEAEASPWVEEEVLRARHRGIQVLPLLLRGEPFFGLSMIQYENVDDGRLPSDRFVQQLRQIVHGTDDSGAGNVRPAPRARTERHLIGAMPPKADGYQHRAVADRLDASLSGGGTAIVTQTILAGMGGVGKTQLAAELAYRAWDGREVDTLVWVNASSAESVVSDYAWAGAEIVGADRDEPAVAARRFLSWLATTEQRWLVVLDDLTNTRHLYGMWPPERGNGRVVVTTRRRDASLQARGRVLDVDAFTPEEAEAYLAEKFADRRDRLVESAELAQELQFLPLALAQAAAYIVDKDIDCATYRDRLAQRPLEQMTPHGLTDDYPRPLAEAWALSVTAANELRPAGLAAPLLVALSLLDPNRIPLAVVNRPSMVEFLARHRGPPGRAAAPVDPDAARDAVDCLTALSLATKARDYEGRPMVAVHALIQRATWEGAEASLCDDAVAATADALVALWSHLERDVALGQVLRANAAALRARAGRTLWRPAAHPVLFRAGHSLANVGLATAALEYFENLTADARTWLGGDHPDTLAAHHDFACAYQAAGKLAVAIDELEANLPHRRRVLGPDHPDTLTTRADLARAYQADGQLDRAITEFEQILRDRRRVLGEDHRDTLASRRHLADAYREADRLDEAIAIYPDLLTDCVQVLGARDPDTLACRAGMAEAYQAKGRAHEAAALYRTTLTDRKRALGDTHPETLRTRLGLARALHAAMEKTEAARLVEATQADCERVLGPEHPLTTEARRLLRELR